MREKPRQSERFIIMRLIYAAPGSSVSALEVPRRPLFALSLLLLRRSDSFLTVDSSLKLGRGGMRRKVRCL